MRNSRKKLGSEILKQHTAIRLYADGKASLSEAAAIADAPVGEFMETLTRRCIRQEVPEEFMEKSLKNAKKLLQK